MGNPFSPHIPYHLHDWYICKLSSYFPFSTKVGEWVEHSPFVGYKATNFLFNRWFLTCKSARRWNPFDRLRESRSLSRSNNKITFDSVIARLILQLLALGKLIIIRLLLRLSSHLSKCRRRVCISLSFLISGHRLYDIIAVFPLASLHPHLEDFVIVDVQVHLTQRLGKLWVIEELRQHHHRLGHRPLRRHTCPSEDFEVNLGIPILLHIERFGQ